MLTSHLPENQIRRLAAAARKYQRLRITQCFDSRDPESRPTGTQQLVLDDIANIRYRWAVGGNQSGKSQLGGREVSWVFEENHPKWTRPDDWGTEPLLILVVGKVMKMVEEELWNKKIRPFLEPGTYTEHRLGGVLQKVVHKESGNTILFFSHTQDNEARERLQGYVAHYIWLDEMPSSYRTIEELHRRIQRNRGYFLATFTPKVVNSEIRRMVDTGEAPHSRKYRLRMFDNPVYGKDDRESILASMATYSESYRATLLDGEWSVGEDAVYYFDSGKMIEAPEDYSPAWRHVESVDPALRSKLGYTLWAECPTNGIWYCVRAEYVENIYVPTELVATMREKTRKYNIVRRISDTHESWYLGQAAAMGIRPQYMAPFKKNSRKGELIKNLQEALGSGKVRIAPWCELLISELEECRWSDKADNKIVNASSYHLLDSSQYFVDLMPAPSATPPARNWDEYLWNGHMQRKQKEEKRKKAKAGRIRRRNAAGKSGRISWGRRKSMWS